MQCFNTLFALSACLLLCMGSIAQEGKKLVRQDRGDSPYQIDIDYSQTPQLKDWAEKELRPTLEKWYPIILADLPTNGFVPPQRYSVTIEANGTGVAVTSSRPITSVIG